METIDRETGEIHGNAAVATQLINQAAVQMQAVKMGLGNRSLNDAIEQALKVIPIWITTDKQGAHKVKYATLKTILEAVRPPLLAHRVRIRQGADRSWPCDDGGGSKGRLVPVYTDLIHVVTGEVERTQIEMPLTRLDPQAMGSAITYGKRYTLLAALGLATDDEADDDGARAVARDVTAPPVTTGLLEELKAEIDGCKTKDALIKWGNAPSTKRRINELTDEAAVLVRNHYAERGRKLLEKEE